MTDAPPPRTTCAIAGGGPAGMMLGFLLARAGVEVVVFEKHRDFLRDFRGDTIHPSTLQIMHELGLLDAFLRCRTRKSANCTASSATPRSRSPIFVICRHAAILSR